MIRIRNFTWDDLPALWLLMKEVAEANGHAMEMTEEQLRQQLQNPSLHIERDYTMAWTNDRKLVAAVYALRRTSGSGFATGGGIVHPNYRRQGIGMQMIEYTDANCLKTATQELPEDEPITVNRAADSTQPGDIALLEATGYKAIRATYEMLIELDSPIPEPSLPEGFELRPFDVAQHGHAVQQAHHEAFTDHWGVFPDDYEAWEHRYIRADHFDPELWWIAWDGDEIAGVNICRLHGQDHVMGWVRALGVRRNWRRRGLGEALLQHSFYGFQQRGIKRVGLHVDAASKTNAVNLYERAGMHEVKRHITYRKILRGNATDIKD